MSRQAYINHYEYVRKAVPKDKLLEFHQPFEWKPLCDFLGASVPEGSFPHMNGSEDFKISMKTLLIARSVRTVLRVAPIITATLAILGFWLGWQLNYHSVVLVLGVFFGSALHTAASATAELSYLLPRPLPSLRYKLQTQKLIG